MNDIYKNIEEYNPNNKLKNLIVFDDIITDMITNKKLNPIVTELLTSSSKLNISYVFMTEIYFVLPKNIRLRIIRLKNIRIPNKWEL